MAVLHARLAEGYTGRLEYFYPTDVLVTGYDIIFFWVIRMVFSGLEQTGKEPFHTVLIHGLVRDSQGRKMSKSLGNGIDPLEVIDKYGADALRMTLMTGNAPGNDMRFYWERVEASRNFANKVWNASRFIMMNMEKAPVTDVKLSDLQMADRWILSKVNTLAKDVTENMDKYELGIALQKVYDFIWEEFCDWYIEMVKPRLWSEEDTTKAAALWTLKTVLIQSLKLLHPYMPFITEEIFCNLQDEEPSIMISSWPEYKDEWNFADEEKAVETIKDAVRAIRGVRTSMNVPPSKKAKVYVVSEDPEVLSHLRAQPCLLRNSWLCERGCPSEGQERNRRRCRIRCDCKGNHLYAVCRAGGSGQGDRASDQGRGEAEKRACPCPRAC